MTTANEYWERMEKYEEENGITKEMLSHGKMWPTPSVCGNHNKKGASNTSGDGLSTTAKNWLTPKQPSGGGQTERTTAGGGLRKLEDQVETKPATKKLNPRWVECLMGVPENWVKPDEESSNRIDELRMLGNGVVPQTAAKAFIILINRIGEYKCLTKKG